MNKLLILVFDILLFSNILSNYIPYMNYIDETAVITILILVIIKVIKEERIKINTYQKKIIIYFILFMIVGFISNIFNGLNIEKIVILKDIVAISKFIVVYIGSTILFKKVNKEYILGKLQKRAKVYSIIFMFFAIVNLLLEIGMSYEVRYGFRSYKFIYEHPTYLVLATVIMMSILSAKNEIKNKKYINLCIIVLILTFRSKAFMFILIYFIFKYLKKYINNFKISYIGIIGITGVILFKDKILEYIQYGVTAARPALYIIGVKLAGRFFPFGSGFGTFASSLSGEYYSPLYYQYNISTVIGLRRNSYNYMADTFWPYIYGQFGVLGMILFVLIIINIFKDIRRDNSKSFEKTKASLLVYLYVLISSTSESIFTSAEIILICLTLTTFIGNDMKKYKFEKEFEILNI